MFEQIENCYCIKIQIFSVYSDKIHESCMVTLDKMNIMENCIYVHTAIIVNYFAMETQFNHLLAFHGVCSLARFKMKHYLNIGRLFANSFEDKF